MSNLAVTALPTLESDFDGPSWGSTDNAVARWDWTSGSTLQDSSVLIDDSDNMTWVNDLTVTWDLTVNWTTTTLNTATLTVDDPNIELNSVASPTNANADTWGITLKWDTDKIIQWLNATSSWTFDQGIDMAGNGIISTDAALPITVGTWVWDDFTINTSGFVYEGDTGQVGIGVADPLALLHIKSASSGATASTEADDVIIEGSWDVGFSILAGITANSNIFFGDSGDNDIGLIKYRHASDTMLIGVAGATAITLASSGATFAGAVTAASLAADNTTLNADVLTSTGALWLTATDAALNVTVGTGAGDDFTINTTWFVYQGDTGDIIVGDATGATVNGGTGAIQVLGTDAYDSSITLGRWSANTQPPTLRYVKSRNATIGSNTIVADDDIIGKLYFWIDDWADFESEAAEIRVEIDGTPWAWDAPWRIIFATTPDGSAAPAEAMRISQDKAITMAGTLGVTGAVTANAGLTIDNLSIDSDTITTTSWNALGLTATDAALNVTIGTGAGDDFTINTTGLTYSGDLGFVGIGITSPEDPLDVIYGGGSNDYRNIRLTGVKTDATIQRVGMVAQHYTAAEEPMAMIAAKTASGLNDLYIGGQPAQANAATTIHLMTGATSTTTTGTDRMTIQSDGGIFMNNLLAAAASTDVNINGSNELHSVTSSKRYKENIVDSSLTTDNFDQIVIKEYDFKNGSGHEYGLIAEELEELYPNFVVKNNEWQPESVQYSRLCLLLIKKVQELESRLSNLES